MTPPPTKFQVPRFYSLNVGSTHTNRKLNVAASLGNIPETTREREHRPSLVSLIMLSKSLCV